MEALDWPVGCLAQAAVPHAIGAHGQARDWARRLRSKPTSQPKKQSRRRIGLPYGPASKTTTSKKTTLAQDSSTAGAPISRNVLSYFLCPRATVRSCVHASQTVSLAARFRVEVTLLWKSWRM
jgi:hypothetical protein